MASQSITWSYGASSGNTQPKGLTYCSNAYQPGQYGYVVVSSSCYDTYAHVYFEAYVYAQCLNTVTVPDFTYDGRQGTFCDESLVSLNGNLFNCGNRVSQNENFAGCVRVIGASTGTVYYEAYRFLDNYYTTIPGGTATVDEDGVYIRVYVPNKHSDEIEYIGLGPLPTSITYTANTSAPTSTTTIDATNELTVGGVSYRYKTGTSLKVTTTASGGCPKTYTYSNVIRQNGSIVGESNNPETTFTLSKCIFSQPYVVTGHVSNSSGTSNETSYNVLIGGAPESLILNNSVIYLAPGTQAKLYVSGKTYANSITCNISATTSNVVSHTVNNININEDTGAFTIEITLTGVFDNPSTYLNISVTDIYGTTIAPQCYVEGGVESSFTLSPRYPLVRDTVVFTNTSISGNNISYTWTINGSDPTAESDDWTAYYSGDNLVASFNKGGTYTISLKTQYLTQFEDTYTLEIDVGKTVNASEPSARYKVLITNGEYSALIGRSILVPNNGKCIFTNLKFASKENESSQATFRLIGGNTLVGLTWYELIRQSSKVFILDDNVVVWSGIITDISETNTKSPFSSEMGYVKYHDIICMDAIYELMSEQYEGETATITDTAQNLLVGTSSYEGILPESSAGIIGYESQDLDNLTQTVSFPFTNTDRYSLLVQLISLTGWNYRTRPNVIEARTSCTISGNTCTYESSNDIKAGDLIYVDVGDYQDGLYHAGTMFGVFSSDVTANNKTFTFAVNNIKNPLGKTTGYVTVVRPQNIYDVAPSFYQSEYVRRYTVDKDINNVSSVASVNDKYGIVSVTTRSIQGTTITSQMKGFMKINEDYSIPSAYVVVKSIDTYVVSVTSTPNSDSSQFGDSYIYLKGWTTPTDTTEYYSFGPSFYRYYPWLDQPSGTQFPSPYNIGYIKSIERYVGGDNDKYTKLTIQDIFDATGSQGHKGMSWVTSVGFSQGTFILGTTYTLNTTEGISAGDYMMLGDEVVYVTSVSGNNIVVDRSGTSSTKDNKTAHSHMVGTLAFKISSYTGPTSSDVEDGSPYDLYGNTVYTNIAANGLTQMEIELIAQNLLRFGSNYMDNGSATIPLIFFGKTDKGMFSPFNVGDHISINPAYAYSDVKTEFKLIGYEVDTQKYMATITYGMPTKTMADVLRGVSTNQMVTISNSDYQ